MVTKPLAALRDAVATRQRILAAAAGALAAGGTQALGVGALAKQAGVDKVLIYRYFGGLDGVIAALADRIAAPAAGEIAATSYAEALGERLVAYAAWLRNDPLARGALALQSGSESEGARRLAQAQARAMRAVFARGRVRAQGATRDPDPAAIDALLIAGIHRLVMLGGAAGEFAGLDLRDAGAWPRIEAALKRAAWAIHRPAPVRAPES